MCKVSVIVPVYNVEDYIKECLDSLINQTLTEIEIILVDDGSTDKSGSICDDYAKKDARIKVIHKENGGQSSARNVGLGIARGEYVLFVDSDDYVDRNTLETLLKAAKEHDADIVHGDLLNDSDRMKDDQFRRLACDNIKVSGEQFLQEKIKTQTYDIVPFLYFVRREYLLKNNIEFLEGHFYEDQLWTMQLLSKGASIVKVRFPYYYYRMDRPGSTTNNMYLKKGVDSAVICNQMAEYIDKCENEQMKKCLKVILLLSMFQFKSVWLRLTLSDRKIAWKTINSGCFDIALECDCSYKDLRSDVMKFYKNKEIQAIKYDINKTVRRVLKRR